jgi:hypothetical protein
MTAPQFLHAYERTVLRILSAETPDAVYRWICWFTCTAAALLAVAFTAGAAILVLGGK